MSANLQACLDKLVIICKIKDPNLREQVLKDIADYCIFNALREICKNAIYVNIPLSNYRRKKLFNYKKVIEDITAERISKAKKS